MKDETRQEKLEDALIWLWRIDCCSDKERVGLRVWDLLYEMGFNGLDVPTDVVTALKRLMGCDAYYEPCKVVDAYLNELLNDWENNKPSSA